jgi:pimeloyl-ACP methyl ester carboxylesterase
MTIESLSPNVANAGATSAPVPVSEEHMIHTGDAELCVQTFGNPGDPAILLIHGACASMLAWEASLCERLAARGRFVIRYDNRDTGRSTAYPPHAPGYSLATMVEDAIAVLDHHSIGRSHIVGRSMAGAIALALGLEHRDRVLTLTFVATTPGGDDLPPMTDEFLQAASGQPDFSDPQSVEDHIVSVLRAYAGRSPYFDAAAVRALVREDMRRTRNIESMLTNHFEIAFDAPAEGGPGDLTVPCLVVHGEIDPVFPLAHGVALRDAIPDAKLLVLPRTGHLLPEPMWTTFVDRLIQHTSRG